MNTNGKQSISVDADTRKEIAAAVEQWPWVGKTLAFLIRRGWWAVVFMVVLFFLIVPFVTPLLSALYVKALPEALRDSYANWVVDAYGEKIKRSIDIAVKQEVDRNNDNLDKIVAKNNANLDFVQQFRAEWTDPKEPLTRAYRFPLKEGQEFNIEFRPDTPAAVPCKANDARVGPAGDALQGNDLFQINVNKDAATYSVGVYEDPVNWEFSKEFWNTMAKNTSTIKSAESDAGIVEISIRPNTAQTVLPCFRLAGDLRVIVYKTIDPADPALRSAASTPDGNAEPASKNVVGEPK